VICGYSGVRLVTARDADLRPALDYRFEKRGSSEISEWLRVSPLVARQEGAVANRFSLLFTMGLAMLCACAGIALAQTTDPAQGEDLVAPVSSLEEGEVIPNRYIVVLDKDVASPATVARDLAGQLDFETTYVYDDALEGFAAEIPSQSLSALRSDPRVEFVAKDRVVEAFDQTLPTGIERVDADVSSTAAGNGSGEVDADIAILDSGIYKTHSDLNIAGGYNCVGRNQEAWSDGNGHGTHVAGTAAAKDDSIGVVGVAPGARLWAVKVLKKDGSGSISSAICGIDWVTGKNTDGVTNNDIEVANISLGATVSGHDNGGCGWTRDRAVRKMHQAICNSVAAGVTYTVAAGNERQKFAQDIPAAFNQVLTVTAMADFNGEPGGGAPHTCRRDVDDTFANFSNYTTPTSPDANHTIAAPGVCIESTWKGGGYETISGTSMASPHVAGTAVLCIAAGDCSGTPANIIDKLRSDAGAQPTSYGFIGDPNDPYDSRYYGYLEYAGGY
jgi:subtilisin